MPAAVNVDIVIFLRVDSTPNGKVGPKVCYIGQCWKSGGLRRRRRYAIKEGTLVRVKSYIIVSALCANIIAASFNEVGQCLSWLIKVPVPISIHIWEWDPRTGFCHITNGDSVHLEWKAVVEPEVVSGGHLVEACCVGNVSEVRSILPLEVVVVAKGEDSHQTWDS